jgi:hypothetical protein
VRQQLIEVVTDQSSHSSKWQLIKTATHQSNNSSSGNSLKRQFIKFSHTWLIKQMND